MVQGCWKGGTGRDEDDGEKRGKTAACNVAGRTVGGDAQTATVTVMDVAEATLMARQQEQE